MVKMENNSEKRRWFNGMKLNNAEVEKGYWKKNKEKEVNYTK